MLIWEEAGVPSVLEDALEGDDMFINRRFDLIGR